MAGATDQKVPSDPREKDKIHRKEGKCFKQQEISTACHAAWISWTRRSCKFPNSFDLTSIQTYPDVLFCFLFFFLSLTLLWQQPPVVVKQLSSSACSAPPSYGFSAWWLEASLRLQNFMTSFKCGWDKFKNNQVFIHTLIDNRRNQTKTLINAKPATTIWREWRMLHFRFFFFLLLQFVFWFLPPTYIFQNHY